MIKVLTKEEVNIDLQINPFEMNAATFNTLIREVAVFVRMFNPK